MIKDYVYKPKLDVTTPGLLRPIVVLIAAGIILIVVLIVILLSVSIDHKIDRASVDQVDLVVATEKIEVAKPIPVEPVVVQ